VRNKLIAHATLVFSALAVVATPIAADARTKRVLVCEAGRNARNTGTAIGAVTGGLLGNAVSSGGGKTGGTIIGAGLGAVAGHEIAKSNGKKNCHYVYRKY
jgi:uncharacterized protein YcfJ